MLISVSNETHNTLMSIDENLTFENLIGEISKECDLLSQCFTISFFHNEFNKDISVRNNKQVKLMLEYFKSIQPQGRAITVDVQPQDENQHILLSNYDVIPTSTTSPECRTTSSLIPKDLLEDSIQENSPAISSDTYYNTSSITLPNLQSIVPFKRYIKLMVGSKVKFAVNTTSTSWAEIENYFKQKTKITDPDVHLFLVFLDEECNKAKCYNIEEDELKEDIGSSITFLKTQTFEETRICTIPQETKVVQPGKGSKNRTSISEVEIDSGFNNRKPNPSVYVQPSIGNACLYKKQNFEQFVERDFTPPEKNLPGYKYQRYKRGFVNRSRVVDLETGEIFQKHKGNEQVIMQRQEKNYQEKVNQLKSEHEQKELIRKHEHLKQEKEFERLELEKVTQSKIEAVKHVGKSALNGGAMGMVGGVIGSATINVIEVYRGKKKLKEAIVEVGKAGLMGGVSGTVVSGAFTSLQVYGVNSSNALISQLSNKALSYSGAAIPVLFCAWSVFCEIKKYSKGEITKGILCKNLVSLAVNTAAGVGGSLGAVALASFLLPGIGSLLSLSIGVGGSLASYVSSNFLESQFASVIKDNPEDTLKAALLFFGLTKTNMHLLNQRYKELAKIHHPDRGGTNESFTQLTTYYGVIAANVEHYKPNEEILV